MTFFTKIKDKIDVLLHHEPSSEKNDSSVYANIEDLVKEQFNVKGLSLFKTSAKSTMSGPNASPFKGKGMEFDEVRLYNIGDDMRTIDWRVTARRGDTYTKLFKEERERQVVILADMRSPMHFATKGIFKSVMVARLSALISWAALDASEKVGGIVTTDENTVLVPPHRSRKKVLALLNALSKASFVDKGNDTKKLSLMLSELRRAVRTGGIVFIISDFHDFDDKAKQYLTQISGKCDVVAINVIDRLEEKAPPEDRYLVTDGHKTMTLYADNYLWREQYETMFKEKHDKFDDFCKKRGIKNIWARTSENPADILKSSFTSFASKRKR